MLSEEGTQQGDPEAPPLFAEAIQTLAKKLEFVVVVVVVVVGDSQHCCWESWSRRLL